MCFDAWIVSKKVKINLKYLIVIGWCWCKWSWPSGLDSFASCSLWWKYTCSKSSSISWSMQNPTNCRWQNCVRRGSWKWVGPYNWDFEAIVFCTYLIPRSSCPFEVFILFCHGGRLFSVDCKESIVQGLIQTFLPAILYM